MGGVIYDLMNQSKILLPKIPIRSERVGVIFNNYFYVGVSGDGIYRLSLLNASKWENVTNYRMYDRFCKLYCRMGPYDPLAGKFVNSSDFPLFDAIVAMGDNVFFIKPSKVHIFDTLTKSLRTTLKVEHVS